MWHATVTTSWDDGHALDLRLAALLKKYGIKGTFYIAPKNREIDPAERLNAAQIVELAAGFEIGAHTITHPRLTDISDVAARKEIEESKAYLECILKKDVNSFCYPAGDYDKRHMAYVREAGFTYARTVACFSLDGGKDKFAAPTTVHAYRHWSRALPILKYVGVTRFINCYLNWDALAIALFDKVRAQGGVFHLWGHSWEIEKNNGWQRLEKVLQHIAHRPDVRYCANSELS